jgi:pimeloyl-[acyl-carrier protein] methyl ester esterase
MAATGMTGEVGAAGAARMIGAGGATAVPALYSETSGDIHADPLVLLHGWGMNLRVFDGMVAVLAGHYRVTVIDLPGHGASPWTAQTTPQSWLASLAATLPRAATLVGWSLGGQLALQLAAQPALAVRRLVLIASSPRFVQAPDWPAGLTAATLQAFAAQLERDAPRTIADFLELQVRGSLDAAGVRTRLQQALQQHGAAHPAALRAGLELLEHNDLRELARRVDLPALLIAGQYDRVTPPQAAQALARLMPRAQLLQIPRAGHAPFLSHPAPISAALLDFMRADARP